MSARAKYPATSSTGSRLIDCLSFRYLKPVRAEGPTVHLIERDIAYTVPRALCGAEPTITARNAPVWRSVHAKGVAICMGCHAASCAEPSRIDWSLSGPAPKATVRLSPGKRPADPQGVLPLLGGRRS